MVFLPFLGQQRDIVSREWRHAEVAREMLVSGDYLVPQLFGAPYPDKPPMMYAAIALTYSLAGHASLELARLPSVAAAIIGAVCVYWIGIVLSGRTAGLLAAFGLMGVQGYSYMARSARPDMILTMLVLLSCLAGVLGMRSRGGRRALWLVCSGICGGLALLTKGPLGIAFAVIAIALLPSGSKSLRRLSAWDWTLLIVASIGVAAAWALPVYLRDHGTYLLAMLTQPDLSLHPDRTSRHFYYYLAYYLVPVTIGFLPLTLLAPAVVRDVLRRGWSPALKIGVTCFFLLSVLPKKRPHYALPILPFLALAVADATVEFNRRGVLRFAQILIALSLGAGPLYFAAIQPYLTPIRSAGAAFADSMAKLIEPHRTVVAIDDIVEPLAFMGYAGRMVESDGVDHAVTALCAGGKGSYLLISSEASAQDQLRIQQGIAKLPLKPVLQGRLPEPVGKRYWQVYQLGAACD